MSSKLPITLAGPILRRCDTEHMLIWVATSCKVEWQVEVLQQAVSIYQSHHARSFQIGGKLYVTLLDVTIQYDEQKGAMTYQLRAVTEFGAKQTLPDTPSNDPKFYSCRPTGHINKLLHGSCRKPHHQQTSRPYSDGLAHAADYIANHDIGDWPDVLILSGDQIYADDVAGPMLNAIHQVIALLGLPEETLGNDENNLQGIHTFAPNYYQRETLLPSEDQAQASQTQEVKRQFFDGVKKPIFSSDNAHNHLITFSEVMAMYLLCWSPALWRWVNINTLPSTLPEQFAEKYEQEKLAIKDFQRSLSAIVPLLAQIPSAMMFDDHDVTDDWNLTAEWEQLAYGNPLSKRIIGNALMGYFLCQGWGNAPEHFPQAFLDDCQNAISRIDSREHDEFINSLLSFHHWHYEWDTNPKLVVLDTRTHRWRSESNFGKPSGLMDWEALTDLQQNILSEPAVILVSPAPVFGVKLIETIQRLFTLAGKPLLVDAENWMAHPGAAHALLNMFKHPKTPQNFVILSGDVHYSFVYDIHIRSRLSSPNIWQITSSGIRNEFPDTLLNTFDRLDRWLYAPWSPLNLFTKRRNMHITPCKPEGVDNGERLLNQAGIGLVELDKSGRPTRIAQLCNTGDIRTFEQEKEAHHRP